MAFWMTNNLTLSIQLYIIISCDLTIKLKVILTINMTDKTG